MQSGQMLSHYRLLEKIGQGGMGVIWKALDTKLGRHVALKILPPELTADPERRRRLLREARTAAAVTHPNIATIYEVGEVDGITFISMELVEGRTLRSVLGGRPLEIPEALRLATEIAEGLARAHQAGIVHRDLKPENIIIGADGHSKILDFGLAKLVAQREVLLSQRSQQETHTQELTREGAIVGTTAYMSPEQVRGEDVDARSDIFSFGVVLYEMVAGRVPFRGQNRFETLAAILDEPAVAASRLNAKASARLDEVLGKCLEKDRTDRYQSCQDLVVDLRRVGRDPQSASSRSYASAQTSTPAEVATWPATRRRIAWAAGVLLLLLTGAAVVWLRPSRQGGEDRASKPASVPTAGRDLKVATIAVLPFVNMSGDHDNEYFSDGVAEELLNALAKNPALRVVARTSSFSFKGKDVDITEIGRRLHAETILEGSVRKQGDQVRITVQLVNAPDGYHIWSQTYDRRLESIFAVQDDIARSVMSSLRATLPDDGDAEQRTGNTEAYNLVLRARYYWNRSNPGDLERSRDLLRQALTLEPGNAGAWVWLGWTYTTMVQQGILGPEEGIKLTREAAERALALDDSQVGARVILGSMNLLAWDWPGVEAELGKAQALDPRGSGTLILASLLAGVQGRTSDAIEINRQYLEVDPLSMIVLNNQAVSLLEAGRPGEALEHARMILDLDAQRIGAHALIGRVLLAQGKPDAALQEILQEPSERFRLYGLAQTYHRLGRKAESDGALAEYMKLPNILDYDMACIHAVRGDLDEAFAWLDRAYARHDPNLTWLKSDSDLANLRGDARWPPLLRKMRLAD